MKQAKRNPFLQRQAARLAARDQALAIGQVGLDGVEPAAVRAAQGVAVESAVRRRPQPLRCAASAGPQAQQPFPGPAGQRQHAALGLDQQPMRAGGYRLRPAHPQLARLGAEHADVVLVALLPGGQQLVAQRARLADAPGGEQAGTQPAQGLAAGALSHRRRPRSRC